MRNFKGDLKKYQPHFLIVVPRLLETIWKVRSLVIFFILFYFTFFIIFSFTLLVPTTLVGNMRCFSWTTRVVSRLQRYLVAFPDFVVLVSRQVLHYLHRMRTKIGHSTDEGCERMESAVDGLDLAIDRWSVGRSAGRCDRLSESSSEWPPWAGV